MENELIDKLFPFCIKYRYCNVSFSGNEIRDLRREKETRDFVFTTKHALVFGLIGFGGRN